MDKRILKFTQCDSRFYSYLEKVFNRMPQDVKEEILNDKAFEIIADEDYLTAYGLYIHLDNPIKSFVYLNLNLKLPEYEILHTIVHELAHHVAGSGETDLWEKEAEELVRKWGFENESEQVKYHLPIRESIGHKLGYAWAKEQPVEELLDRFETYYIPWNEGRLTGKFLENFYIDADPYGIVAKAEGTVEEHPTPDTGKGDVFMGADSLELAVLWGIMGVIKEIIQREKNPDNTQSEYELMEALKRIHSGFEALFSLPDYWKNFNAHRKKFTDVFLVIDNLLEGLQK
jgi:hypothetical protein